MAKLAFRQVCLTCAYQQDGSTRKRCPRDGGTLQVLTGLWGIFEWRGDGRYRYSDAIRIYRRKGSADRSAVGMEVVRWLPAELLLNTQQ